ncbi:MULTISPECIES: glycoside hydrolase family 2 protein [unclassified Chitinophaga]|uniref:glycoside hydrolase family 2 protein n=1 Tax=unclassified Chitinophaga TaxID=2619133 RepID=UPI00300FF94D
MKRNVFFWLVFIALAWLPAGAQQPAYLCRPTADLSLFLNSGETIRWQMQQAAKTGKGDDISSVNYDSKAWLPAQVPGTVLTNLVANKIYPDPYYGDNNRKKRNLIPDIADAGREFYHYWFRTDFRVPASYKGKRIWLKFNGINYRCTIWLNGARLGDMAGMFNDRSFDITTLADLKGKNVLAVDVQPVDFPGAYDKAGAKRTGAVGENHNGGDGEMGKNVSMLMSVGWDFTAPDGIRDRNTGIWRDVELFATGDVILAHPFVKTSLPLPDTTSARETISVEVSNASDQPRQGIITGSITQPGIKFSAPFSLAPHETRTLVFTPEEFKALTLQHPRLWWPVNKGEPYLYDLDLRAIVQNKESHHVHTQFGVRTVTTDRQTPDKSRRFLVNGQPVFIRGTNWVPEAMLRNSRLRTYSELRYTRQAGINLLRLWAGGVAESYYFYELCDRFGLLVWNEFWITGDTRMPADTALYLENVKSTVKRIRNHASVAYYVGANESKEMPGEGKLILSLDDTHGYQEQSECCGVHDGSPYKYENPMQYFENTASRRGSRVDGFNPEYGAPCTPVYESLKRMMPEKDLWPINDSVWTYLDGNGFHQVNTQYRQAVNEFGESSSIQEYAKKAQLVGALNFRAIWEVWNYNKFSYGDRWTSGFLFWYHNSPLPQTASRMYDWYLEPTAALYYSQNALAPLHPQFDYLKNSVSVYNDYRRPFTGYTVEATVYDLDAQPVRKKLTTINIPADGVVNDVIKIDFPENITQVHFIKLTLKDEHGRLINDAFYWRSKDSYKGAWTMTGPAVSGFADINKLKKANLNVSVKKEIREKKMLLKVTVANPSAALSFFTRLKLAHTDGSSVTPAFYSDNFFSLLPGEVKYVDIEIPAEINYKNLVLVTGAFNSKSIKITL